MNTAHPLSVSVRSGGRRTSVPWEALTQPKPKTVKNRSAAESPLVLFMCRHLRYTDRWSGLHTARLPLNI